MPTRHSFTDTCDLVASLSKREHALAGSLSIVSGVTPLGIKVTLVVDPIDGGSVAFTH